MSTVGELLAASPLPRLEARLLLMHATGLSRTKVMAYPEIELTPEQEQAFARLQERRLAGEPVAYLLGEREFYGRAFRVTPDVLIPRPETELLVEWGMQRIAGRTSPRILDLGTGSGVIAITLALACPTAEVWAIDLSAAALDIARENAKALGARVKLRQSDWFANVPPQLFDLIVSNPPYIEKDDLHLRQGDLRFEPPQALTDFQDGLSCLRRIFSEANGFLKPGAWVGVEHGYDQGDAARAIAAAAGLHAIETIPDLAGLDRVTGGMNSGV